MAYYEKTPRLQINVPGRFGSRLDRIDIRKVAPGDRTEIGWSTANFYTLSPRGATASFSSRWRS